jgi:hypothetical protein
VPVLYYYFHRNELSAQTCENFIRSITFQLLHYLEDIPDSINNLYARCNSGSQRPAVSDLTACFISIIHLLPLVYLVGDAFDECNQWDILWSCIRQIVGSKCASLHFMLSSRPEQHIQYAVNSLNIPSINLNRHKMNHNVEKIVNNRLDREFNLEISPKGKLLTQGSLFSRANGICLCLSLR